ncbi:hypothetical protein N7474_010164 [Penicillium riverlandense]|uniref:uncharacterized protein n=1 Tax=Penicillium riverlandense TaxID=1903569 RepID=UPI0025466950|nr:uncharacterized protein N7474_010164 [Penicillium riverlandense]KAJ5808895.1 hypothetical protein N7474_010164 [Penicillium riverlandense]
MHAIIAVATTHICQISHDNSGYRVAEAFHWQQAVTQYSKEVATCITQANMDKLYPACMLITVQSFTLKEYNPRESFVFSDDPTSLNWLFLQGGMRYLLERTNQWLPQSMWFSHFMQVRDDPSFDFDDSRPGRVGLDPDLADLCGITEASTLANNPYLWPLRMLMQFLPLEQKPPCFRKYFNWVGRLEPEYQQCLLQKETPAMILLAWWLALMCCTNLWWLDARVRSECTAICMRLEDSDDPLVLRLLEFPAEQCGYILRHVQEQTCIELEADLTLP